MSISAYKFTSVRTGYSDLYFASISAGVIALNSFAYIKYNARWASYNNTWWAVGILTSPYSGITDIPQSAIIACTVFQGARTSVSTFVGCGVLYKPDTTSAEVYSEPVLTTLYTRGFHKLTGGSVSIADRYNYVTCVSTPKANANYRFVEWRDSSGNKINARTGIAINSSTGKITIATSLYEDIDAYAYFEPTAVVFAVSGGTGGSITSSRASGSLVPVGESISVTATPEYNYAFNKWTGSGISDSISASYSFAMPAAPVTLTASFTIKADLTASVSFENLAMGSVEYKHGDTVIVADTEEGVDSFTMYVGVKYTLTAAVTDSELNRFLGWYSGAGVLLTDKFSHIFTPATDADIAVVAKFAEKLSYVVTKRSSDGSVPYSATNDAAEAGCDFTIRPPDFKSPDRWLGGNRSCTAVPATGWQLAQWTVAQGIPPASLTPRHQDPPPPGTGTPSNPYWFDLAFDAVVHAIFTKIPYTVTVTADPAAVDAGAVTDCFVYDDTFTEQEEITVLHGDDCEIWATAADGFSFAGWYLEDGTCVSTDRPYAPVVTSDLTLIAKFKATVSLTAAYSVNADEEGTVQIDGGTAGATATKAVIIGETCTITAIGVEPVGEAEGAIFNSWHLSTDTLFEEPIAGYLQEQEITVDGNLTLNAYFVGDADLETRYLALRNYNNNTSADDPLIGILESSGGEEIEALEYFTFIYGGAPPAPAMPGAGEPGPRYFKFTGTQSTTLGASSVAGLGFMRWERVHLVAVDLPGEGDPHWTLSTPAVVVGTSPTPTILTSRHFVMTAVWGDPQPVLLTVKYASGSDSSMGSFNADPETEAKQTVQGGFSDVHLQDSEVLLTANVLNGYLFSGWYYDSAGTLLVSADTAYTHKIGSPVTIYAKFIQDTDAIYRWEGDTAKKMLRWRSKRYVAVRPFNPSAARVYADAYPVTLNLYMASSPDAPVSATVEVQVKRQDGLRLPMARPEKYMEVEVTATGDVTEVAVGTSMGGLAQ